MELVVGAVGLLVPDSRCVVQRWRKHVRRASVSSAGLQGHCRRQSGSKLGQVPTPSFQSGPGRRQVLVH